MDECYIRKRHYSQCEEEPAVSDDTDGQPSAKYREKEHFAKLILTDFPDEVLCEIFKYLDSWTHCMVMNSCMRFKNLLLDRRFSQKIESDEKPLSLIMIQELLERAYVGTSSIKLRGPSREYTSLEVENFNRTLAETFTLRSTNLSILELHSVTINLDITLFPASLKRLMLSECNITNDDDNLLFYNIATHLFNLEEVGIEFSRWFHLHYLMDLSKIPNLRWLSLRGCPRVHGTYPGAWSFRLKKLEYLDLRCTPIYDTDLMTFKILPLKELLLDCPVNMRYKEAGNGKSVQTNEENSNANDCEMSTSKASSGGTSADRTMNPASSSTTSSTQLLERNQQPSNFSPHASRSTRCSTSAFSLSSISSSLPPTSSSLSSSSSPPSISPSRPNTNAPVEGNLPLPVANMLSRIRLRLPQLPVINYNHQLNYIQQMVESRRHRPVPGSISDDGITSLSRPRNVATNINWIYMLDRPGQGSLERLTIRNYKLVTDISLERLARCAQLVFLDLSGTSVTPEGIQRFKIAKPNCKIIADHLKRRWDKDRSDGVN